MKKIIYVSLILIILIIGGYFIINQNENNELNNPIQNITYEESNIIKGPTESVIKYKGLWLPFLEETQIAANDIENLKENGINIVAIGIRLFATDENKNWEFTNLTEYENETEILKAINTFHKNKIKTILILNPAHGDFGVSPYPSENTGKPILEMLNPLVLKWAEIAEKYGVEIFCPTNEPALLASEEDISVWAQEILPKIKNVYSGKTAFRVHNEGDDYPVYNIKGYDYVLPYVTHCSKDVDRGGGYLEHMKENNINNIIKIKQKYPNYRYIFFEVAAYTGPDYYWWEPIAPANMKNNAWDLEEDFMVVSEDGQAKCFELFFDLGWNETDGYLITTAKGFEFKNKPAELIIREWYNK